MLVWIFSSKIGINHGECNSDVRLMWLHYSLVSLVQDQSAEIRAQQTVHQLTVTLVGVVSTTANFIICHTAQF